jgi:hypothetical protein
MLCACLTPEKWDEPKRVRATSARALKFPVSDASWRSEELLERTTQLGRFSQHRTRQEDGRVRQSDWRKRWRDGWRGAAGHAHHAAVHVVLLLGLVFVATFGAAIMRRRRNFDRHWTVERAGRSQSVRRQGEGSKQR